MYSLNLSLGKLLTYPPAIALVGMYQKKRKTLIQKAVSAPGSPAALFTAAKTRKRHKCPLLGDWIRKHTPMHTGNTTQPAKEGNLAVCNSMDGP